MRELLFTLGFMILLSPFVLAFNKFGDKGGFWYFYKAIYFVLASFMFSVIFWLTHHWIEALKNKKKKRK